MKTAIALLVVIIFAAPARAQNAPSVVTVDDVVTLYKAGISENVLITRIKQSNKPLQLSTALTRSGSADSQRAPSHRRPYSRTPWQILPGSITGR